MNLKISLHAYTRSRLRQPKQDRETNKFATLQERTEGFRIEEGKYDSDSLKERWVISVSSKELTLVEVSLLQQGLKFTVTPKAHPVSDIVVVAKEAYQHLGKEKQPVCQVKLLRWLKKAKPSHSNLHPRRKEGYPGTKRRLRHDTTCRQRQSHHCHGQHRLQTEAESPLGQQNCV